MSDQEKNGKTRTIGLGGSTRIQVRTRLVHIKGQKRRTILQDGLVVLFLDLHRHIVIHAQNHQLSGGVSNPNIG